MNWTLIISEISDAGVSQAEMAKRCKCGQSTISEIYRGEIKNPSFSIGNELVALHSEVVKKAA